MSIESINNKLITVLHMDNDGWVDDKGSNDGTAFGGPVFSDTSPAPILGTHSGDFDISDDYVQTGNTGLDKDKGGFHFLFAPSRSDGNTWILFNWGTQALGSNRVLFIRRFSKTLHFELNGALPAGFDVSGWAIDSVHQLIGVWNNGTQKFYIDGILFQTATYTPLTAKNTNVYINGESGLKGGGLFDEVAYFDDILTDGGVSDGQIAGGEIAELFNNGNYLILNQIAVFQAAWARNSNQIIGAAQ